MPSDTEINRELARAYWAGKPIACPKHPGATMTGSFVQTTFAVGIGILAEASDPEALSFAMEKAATRILETSRNAGAGA